MDSLTASIRIGEELKEQKIDNLFWTAETLNPILPFIFLRLHNIKDIILADLDFDLRDPSSIQILTNWVKRSECICNVLYWMLMEGEVRVEGAEETLIRVTTHIKLRSMAKILLKGVKR